MHIHEPSETERIAGAKEGGAEVLTGGSASVTSVRAGVRAVRVRITGYGNTVVILTASKRVSRSGTINTGWPVTIADGLAIGCVEELTVGAGAVGLHIGTEIGARVVAKCRRNFLGMFAVHSCPCDLGHLGVVEAAL